MFDLGVMERERREGESDQIEEDPEVPKAPVYHPRVKISTKPQGHQYHLHPKGPAPIPVSGYHADTPITIKAEASRKANSRIH